MTTLKQAWSLAWSNKKGFFTVFGINLILEVILSLITTLGNNLFDGAGQHVWNFVVLILQLGVAFLTVVSGLFLLNKLVVHGQKQSFSQSWKEYFKFFKANWKDCFSTYALWDILGPFLVTLLATVILGFAFLALFGSGIAYVMQMLGSINSYYYGSMDSLLGYILPYFVEAYGTRIFVFVLLALVCLMVYLLLNAGCGYRCMYGIISRVSRRRVSEDAMGQSLLLALIPVVVTAIYVVLLLMCLAVSLLLHGMGFFLFMMILLSLALCIFSIVYGFIAEIKILLDMKAPVHMPHPPVVPAAAMQKGSDIHKPDIPAANAGPVSEPKPEPETSQSTI